jgi:hypothetical protein
MGKKNKQPYIKGGNIPTGTKIPRIELPPNDNSLPPSWRLSMLEMVDPFGWHKIENVEKLNEVLGKLSEFEKLNWNEILVTRKKHNHEVDIGDLCKVAQSRLVEIFQDDVESLVSLRLSGAERVWGIREKSVLKLLWWDPNHQVCPSTKKHT